MTSSWHGKLKRITSPYAMFYSQILYADGSIHLHSVITSCIFSLDEHDSVKCEVMTHAKMCGVSVCSKCIFQSFKTDQILLTVKQNNIIGIPEILCMNMLINTFCSKFNIHIFHLE